jgi:hypothetical protein
MDLWQQITQKIRELSDTVKALRKSGTAYAKAQMRYRILLAKEIARLRLEGIPVTIVGDLARGNEEVAKAKYEEIVAETEYKADDALINSNKLEIRVIENQLNREWGVSKYDGIS